MRFSLGIRGFHHYLSSAKNICFNQIECNSRTGNLSAFLPSISFLPERTLTSETSARCTDEYTRKVLGLEMDVLRQEGNRIPSSDFVKEQHWKEILSLPTKSSRRKYYAFLWHTEKRKERKLIDKHAKILARAEREDRNDTGDLSSQHIIYSLCHTTFLLRIYDTTINLWDNNRLIQAMRYGPKLIFDCSYDEHMTKREGINAAKQLMLSFAANRKHLEPFDIHFCNVNYDGTTMQYFEKHIPTVREPWFPLHLYEQCFTSVFPKEKLVYLTPHCNEVLTEFNYDDIYIIGCMVDKVNNEPLSLAKAKKKGLRMRRLPLDRFLQWRPGSGKSLTLNQMTDILLDIKTTANWESALRHVPCRKIAESFSNTKKKMP